MAWVRNLSTGLVWPVPESHWSLADDGYEVVHARPDAGTAPEPEREAPKAEPKPKGRKPRARSR
jgi:hypothetical protein